VIGDISTTGGMTLTINAPTINSSGSIVLNDLAISQGSSSGLPMGVTFNDMSIGVAASFEIDGIDFEGSGTGGQVVIGTITMASGALLDFGSASGISASAANVDVGNITLVMGNSATANFGTITTTAGALGMSAGCAIVASDTQPLHEAIHHKETGRLVNFFDINTMIKEVCDLLDNPSERARLGANAIQFAKANYDLNSVCLPRQLAWVEGLGQ